jgi:hypothetical protein
LFAEDFRTKKEQGRHLTTSAFLSSRFTNVNELSANILSCRIDCSVEVRLSVMSISYHHKVHAHGVAQGMKET